VNETQPRICADECKKLAADYADDTGLHKESDLVHPALSCSAITFASADLSVVIFKIRVYARLISSSQFAKTGCLLDPICVSCKLRILTKATSATTATFSAPQLYNSVLRRSGRDETVPTV
jgi:hypothetical protein